MERYPHQLSGGMQQRVVIAMALGVDPALLILDEPTTGLDATVEAEVLDLITKLQAEFHTAVLFISHNLGVIRKMCSRVGVLYAGEMVEEGEAEQVLHDPRHPTPSGLLRCIPRGGVRKDHGRLDTIPGFLPPIGADLPGCVFADRCALAEDICHKEKPESFPVGGGHVSRCFFHERAQELPRAMAADLEGAGPGRPARRAADHDRRAGQGLPTGRRQRARPGRRLERDLARRDARAGGRVGSRQDDVRARAARHRRAHGQFGLAGREDARPHARQAHGRRRAGAPDRVPEPGLRAQPPPHGAPDPAPLAQAPGRDHGQCGRRAHPHAQRGRAPARPRRPAAPGAALGRPEAARRDRARVRRRAAPGRLRRAHLGARRLGAGRDPQPARRAAVPARHGLPLHLARSRRRALPLGSHRRALSRAPDGARHGRGRVQRPPPSVHRGAALGGADDRRRAASASASRARSRAPPIHRPGASSTRAARASSATSA